MSARRVLAAVSIGAVSVGAVSLGAAGSLVLAPAAVAGGLPPLTVSKTTVAVNEPFSVSGTGCVSPDAGYPGTGDVLVLGPNSATVTADAAGNWSTTLRFAAFPRDGWMSVQATCHYLTAAGLQQSVYPTVRVTVAGAPASPPTSVAPPKPHSPPPAVTSAPPAAPPAPPPPAGPLPAAPAAGCIACARIASGGPLGAGWPVDLRYTGFQPNEQVALVMHSTPVELGTFTADASGTVIASVRIPDGAAGGEHTFVFSGAASGERLVRFRVTAAAPARVARPATAASRPSPILAAAGAGVVLTLLVEAVVVGVVVVFRRRHRGRTTVAAP